MSRLRRIEISGRFFFVTTNLASKVSPLTPRERDICLAHLGTVRANHSLKVFAYVIMPSHVHLLCRVIESSLPRVMRDWKGQTGFEIARSRGIRGGIWQARYYDFILRRVADFWEKFEYIHQNPVRAGLAKTPGDRRWSSYIFFARNHSLPLNPDPFNLPADHNAPLWTPPWA